jgi:hypothetical protein
VCWNTEHRAPGSAREVVQVHAKQVGKIPVAEVAYVAAGKYHAAPSDHAHGAEGRSTMKVVVVWSRSSEVVSVEHAGQPKPTV